MDVITLAVAKALAKSYTDDQLETLGLSDMSYYFCSSGEYNSSTGVPTIGSPVATTFYIAPAVNNSGLFNMYVYKNSTWTLFHAFSLDLTNLPIDNTLTQTGEAADAKKVGDEITDLKDALNNRILSSKNLLNIDTDVENYYINNANGQLTAYNGWNASDYIPVESGKTYNFVYYTANEWSLTPNVYYAFYDGSKQFTHGDFTGGTRGYSLVAGSSDAYLRVSAAVASMTFRKPMVGVDSDLSGIIGSSDANDYIPYGFTLYKDTIKAEVDSYKNDIAPKLSEVKILLPSTIYICAGRQITFYAPNFVKASNPNNYAYYWWSLTLPLTRIGQTLRLQPTANDIGTYSLHLEVYNRFTGENVASKEITVEVVADTARTNKTVLFIGDSLTNYGYYPYEIQHTLSNGGVVSIGTRTSTGYYDHVIPTPVSVNHEGRGGWSAKDYVTRASKDDITNAFWNPSTSKFDFSYYMSAQEYSAPDVVFINLGTNDLGNIPDGISAIKEMITSIRTYSASIPIVVSAIAGGNAMQGAYTDTFTTLMREQQLEEFDGKLSYVYVAPVYLNLNPNTDFDTEEVAESERNPVIVTRQTGGVHPSRYGLWKIADIYWSVIQKLLS